MYLLFAGQDHYEPSGGIDDFVGVFLTLDAAITEAERGQRGWHDDSPRKPWEWAHIAEIRDGKAKKVWHNGVPY